MPNERFINCTISTPQHKNGKVDFWHRQDGVFDTFTFKFVPNKKEGFNHTVQFENFSDFLKYKI